VLERHMSLLSLMTRTSPLARLSAFWAELNSPPGPGGARTSVTGLPTP
jgi:hypothetical protein